VCIFVLNVAAICSVDQVTCIFAAHILVAFHFTTDMITCATPDLRLRVTFPVAGQRRPLTGINLYCSVTVVHVCEQVAQGCYLKALDRESNLRPSVLQVQRPNHCATRLPYPRHCST